MARDIWCIDNLIDSAAVTADSAVTALGPTRVKDPRLGRVWRPVATTATLTATFAQPSQVDIVMAILRGHSGSGRVTLKLFSGAGSSTPDIFSGAIDNAVDPTLQMMIWIAERDAPSKVFFPTPPDPAPPVGPTTAKLALTITGGVLDVARVWAGKAVWRPMVNHILGSGQGVTDMSRVQTTPRAGAVFTDSAVRLRSQSPNYDAIDVTEWAGPVDALARTAGVAKQCFFVPDFEYYNPHIAAIMGYQQEISPIIASGWRRFQRAFAIQESG